MSKSDATGDTSRPSLAATEKPQAIATIDSLCAAVAIAHLNNFELHRRIAARGIENRRVIQLFAESARLATRDLHEVTAEAHRLIRCWSEQALLDPGTAEVTAIEVSSEVESCTPRLRALLDRQREITESLSSLLATAVD